MFEELVHLGLENTKSLLGMRVVRVLAESCNVTGQEKEEENFGNTEKLLCPAGEVNLSNSNVYLTKLRALKTVFI